ncbi:MAG: DUF302 domain-containing protein [Patescibacteria group bacterium]|nr:DUF302 domain-containing protein [Patescibacteria group bacterium]
MKYSHTCVAKILFEEAVTRIKEELASEGFGVLHEVDVRATLKKKLNVDVDRYVILGACNPQLAYNALIAEKEIGLFLPCNIIVYEEKGTVRVATILPTVAMEMIDNFALKEIARIAEEKLKKAIDRVVSEKSDDVSAGGCCR